MNFVSILLIAMGAVYLVIGLHRRRTDWPWRPWVAVGALEIVVGVAFAVGLS